MHELTRRAYLDAMGITTYVSRAQVPGSALTHKLAITKSSHTVQSPITESSLPPVQAKASGVAHIPSLDLESQPRLEPVVAKRAERVSGGSVDTSPSVEFGIAAFLTPGWLWLEELPLQKAVMREQAQLVQAMASALGWGSGKPEIAQFNWPIYTNKQLDTGHEAARGALGGFINRKLEQAGGGGIVLLGGACKQWVALDQLNTQQQILTVSTSEMLRDGALKKRAWQDLLPYAT